MHGWIVAPGGLGAWLKAGTACFQWLKFLGAGENTMTRSSDVLGRSIYCKLGTTNKMMSSTQSACESDCCHTMFLKCLVLLQVSHIYFHVRFNFIQNIHTWRCYWSPELCDCIFTLSFPCLAWTTWTMSVLSLTPFIYTILGTLTIHGL